MDEDVRQLADQLEALRKGDPGYAYRGYDERLEVATNLTKGLLEKKAAARGFFGRLVGFDPATLYLILQLALLVLDILKRRRQGTF